MKFPLSWLKRYLDTTATANELAAAMTRLGLEVEDVSNPADALKPFVIAKVLTAERHPQVLERRAELRAAALGVLPAVRLPLRVAQALHDLADQPGQLLVARLGVLHGRHAGVGVHRGEVDGGAVGRIRPVGSDRLAARA